VLNIHIILVYCNLRIGKILMFYLLSLLMGVGFLIVSVSPSSAQQAGYGPPSYERAASGRKANLGAAQKNRTSQAERSSRSTKKGSSKSDSAQRKLQQSTPVPSGTTGLSANIQTTGLTSGAPTLYRPTPAQNAPQIQTKLEPTDPSKISGESSEKFSGKYDHLEIWVSHSAHEFKLFGLSSTGQREVLYHTRVGLGSGEFPTPVGVYYVTHIYDEDPWWIPPKDRAWAAGQSPSRKVYGGTMAPLLKKRPVKPKNQPPQSYDLIDAKVKVDDYGYRFHGTNQPRSIGHNQSHGCVRMVPEDARKVAALIKEYVGTADQKTNENGKFVVLRAPVRLNLVK
jgi:hypothetical protein